MRHVIFNKPSGPLSRQSLENHLTSDEINLLTKQGHYNYSMSRRVLTIVTAFILSSLIALSNVPSSHAGQDVGPRLAGSAYDLVNVVNALRSSYGLAPYRGSSILMYTAQSQADFLAATGTMTHTGPGGSGLVVQLTTAQLWE
jgi:uncharacterized protein YkwD